MAHYKRPLADDLHRSWRWFLNHVRGVLERDTETANIVLGRGRTGGPEQFERWLSERATRPSPDADQE